VGFWDAEVVESSTGMSVDDFCAFYLTRGDFFDKVVEGINPNIEAELTAKGVKFRHDNSPPEWISDYATAERIIKSKSRLRGVMPAGDGAATRVKIWNAVLVFRGDARPMMVW